VNLGVRWTKEEGAVPVTEARPYMNPHHPTFEAQASAQAKVSYYPHIDIMLYNFIGPWIETRPYLRQEVGAGLRVSTDGENMAGWKSDTYSGMDFRLGLDLKFSKWDFTAWKSELMNPFEEQLLFEAPSRITATSPEDSLEVQGGEKLKVEYLVESYSPIMDKYFPCPLALMNFEARCGKLSSEHAVTDENGTASVIWELSDIYSVADSLYLAASIVDKERKAIDSDTLTVMPSRWVDLGLPSGILWAAYNVGATSPEEYGDYYAWGDTEIRSDFGGDNYVHYDPITGECINIGENICATEYDAANIKWGNGARLPRVEDMEELINNCSWTIRKLNNLTGMHITGSNGNAIFLPFSGDEDCRDEPYGSLDWGYIWSGTLATEYGAEAISLYYENDGPIGIAAFDRDIGLPIRPVKDKPKDEL
jgi:hypothetical protein